MSAHSAAAWVAAFFLSAVLFSHTVALRLLLLIAGTVLVVIAIVRDRPNLRLLPPIWLPFLLWGAWAALSITWSVEPERSIKEWRNEIVYAGLALWICFVAAQARGAARIILPVLGMAATAVCAVALYHSAQGIGPYSQGLHGGSGNHSSALLTLMPCALLAGWYGRSTGLHWSVQAASWGLAILLAASALGSYNRTVWIGFTVQLLLLAAWSYRKRASNARRRLIAMGGIVALAIAAGAAGVASVQSKRFDQGIDESFEKDPRLALWTEVMDRIEARPLLGYGFGRGMLRHALEEEFDSRTLWHSHNLFLDAIVQVGVPGLLLLLALLAAIARAGWRAASSAGPAPAACGIALVAIVAGMAVRNMTDVLWVRQNALLFWGAVGVLLAWGTVERSRRNG